MDERIGLYNDNGSIVQWPSVDVIGGSYNRPPTTHNLDAQHFVVLPAGFDDWALLDELRTGLAQPLAETTPPTRRRKDEGSGDTPSV